MQNVIWLRKDINSSQTDSGPRVSIDIEIWGLFFAHPFRVEDFQRLPLVTTLTIDTLIHK